MSPINQKNSLKTLSSEKKQDTKKWKEHKLLKAAAGFQKGLEDEMKPEDGHEEHLLLPTAQVVNGINGHSVSRCYTISIAVPGSILENAQSCELRTYLAGQIARAACIYRVDEIVVYDDIGNQNNNGIHKSGENSCLQLVKLLEYLECPQYLRKHMFPLHKDLQYAGLLNPLDAPHHLRQSDDFPFREGVVSHHLLKQGKGSYVNVGLLRDICVNKPMIPDVRVTVKLLPQMNGSKKRHGLLVPPSQPREELGVYWGYTVRLASSLSDVFAKAPYHESYDLTIGTSDKGMPIDHCLDSEFTNFKHALIVFGGLEGLESAMEFDENLTMNDVTLLFDKYLNTCSNQGSRTIRTEEAVLISLAQITSRITAANLSSSDTGNDLELL